MINGRVNLFWKHVLDCALQGKTVRGHHESLPKCIPNFRAPYSFGIQKKTHRKFIIITKVDVQNINLTHLSQIRPMQHQGEIYSTFMCIIMVLLGAKIDCWAVFVCTTFVRHQKKRYHYLWLVGEAFSAPDSSL